MLTRKLMRGTLTAAAVVAAVWLSGCSDESMGDVFAAAAGGRSSGGGGGGSGVGNNNCTSGGTCRSKQMPDGKTWMTENLNISTGSGSWCYNNSNDSCAKYGRLYDWNTASTVCPGGWHLPTRQEWNNLVTAAGGYSTAGSKLKSQTGWNSYSGISSTDQYGFSALPGGYRNDSGGWFYGAGSNGFWWTATENDGSNAYYRSMDYYYDGVDEYYNYESYGFSVRCVAD